MRFGMDFEGPLEQLGRFWAQVGGQVGAKMAPNPTKNDVNKHAQK